MNGKVGGTPSETNAAVASRAELPEGLSSELVEKFPFAIVIADALAPDIPLIYVNGAFERMTGYRREDVLGRASQFLLGEDASEAVRAGLRDATAAGEELLIDVVNTRATGEQFTNRMLLAPIEIEGEITHFLYIASEYSDNQGAVERAAKLDVQLREVQHRVKNHLALLLALIRLEAKKTEDVQRSLSVLANRVEALNLLYDEFSRSANATDGHIALGAYVSRVCSTLNMLGGHGEVRMNLETDEVRASIDAASQIGLLVSELLTNALQHAFGDRDEGLVEVGLWVSEHDDTVCLQVTDNGRGIDAEIDWPNEGSLGARIVRELVKRIEGRLDVLTGTEGTKVTIAIPASAITPKD